MLNLNKKVNNYKFNLTEFHKQIIHGNQNLKIFNQQLKN